MCSNSLFDSLLTPNIPYLFIVTFDQANGAVRGESGVHRQRPHPGAVGWEKKGGGIAVWNFASVRLCWRLLLTFNHIPLGFFNSYTAFYQNVAIFNDFYRAVADALILGKQVAPEAFEMVTHKACFDISLPFATEKFNSLCIMKKKSAWKSYFIPAFRKYFQHPDVNREVTMYNIYQLDRIQSQISFSPQSPFVWEKLIFFTPGKNMLGKKRFFYSWEKYAWEKLMIFFTLGKNMLGKNWWFFLLLGKICLGKNDFFLLAFSSLSGHNLLQWHCGIYDNIGEKYRVSSCRPTQRFVSLTMYYTPLLILILFKNSHGS